VIGVYPVKLPFVYMPRLVAQSVHQLRQGKQLHCVHMSCAMQAYGMARLGRHMSR
jgi:hypothetical protein